MRRSRGAASPVEVSAAEVLAFRQYSQNLAARLPTGSRFRRRGRAASRTRRPARRPWPCTRASKI